MEVMTLNGMYMHSLFQGSLTSRSSPDLIKKNLKIGITGKSGTSLKSVKPTIKEIKGRVRGSPVHAHRSLPRLLRIFSDVFT